MMIGILDPALLLPRPGEEDRLEAEIDEVLQICRRGDVVLPTFEEYWPALWKDLGGTLHRSSSSHRVRRAIDELRKLGCAPRGMPPLPGTLGKGRAYGLRKLFEIPELSPGWLDTMTTVLVRATATGAPVVLITRRMLGRNLRAHQADDSRIEEVTRWVLYLHMAGAPPRAVYCIHHRRNLSTELRWTTRYDWRLPASADGASHPFCPDAAWWKGAVRVVKTVRAKPAFLDAKGYGWARPNINAGKGYHWDVFITDPSVAERVGLDHLNIVEYGAPPKEKSPGTIHHTSGKKEPRLRDDTGWTC